MPTPLDTQCIKCRHNWTVNESPKSMDCPKCGVVSWEAAAIFTRYYPDAARLEAGKLKRAISYRETIRKRGQ